MKRKATTNLNIFLSAVTVISIMLEGCSDSGKQKKNPMDKTYEKGKYGYDVNFLKTHMISAIELTDSLSGAALLIAPGLQGRVMTSTSDGMDGMSYGWINYRFIEAAKPSSQFNPFGGEERIWLGPEGGPFSIYFPAGAEQVFENWKVPEVLDTLPFDIVTMTKKAARFHKEFSVKNASGLELKVDIERSVRLIERAEAERNLGTELGDSLSIVAFESKNVLTNKGLNEWSKDKGFLSIWMLAMFNPSESGTVFIPFREGNEKVLGKIVNDDYFGKVPADRLKFKGNTIFFKTDGKFRSKIGIGPGRALPFCGSYDPANKVLTIMWYTLPEENKGYVNSKWGRQDNPLSGDVVNSYNDGPVEDGSIMGPFYEIESSSPAALLKPAESISHSQKIFHIKGNTEELDRITMKLFGITTDQIQSAFSE